MFGIGMGVGTGLIIGTSTGVGIISALIWVPVLVYIGISIDTRNIMWYQYSYR